MNTRLSAPLRGDYALAVGKFTTGELQRLAQRLEEPRSVVLTPALEMVWRLIKRDRSGIISIPQGGGKSAILEAIGDMMWGGRLLRQEDQELLVGEESEWVFLTECFDADSLTGELWEWEGCPAPTVSEVPGRGGPGTFIQHQEGLTCSLCNRGCILMRGGQGSGLGAMNWNADDVLLGLIRRGGDCPVVKSKMLSNLPRLNASVALEVPNHLSREHIDLLRSVRRDRQLIVLCPPEAVTSLRQALPSLTVRKAPPGPLSLLPLIYVRRLEDAGLAVSPLPPSSLQLLASISRGNPGRFLELVGRLLDDIEVDGYKETVPTAYVASHIRDEFDDDLALELVIRELKQTGVNWAKVKTVRRMLRQYFSLDLKEDHVGRVLSGLGLKKRRNPDSEYFIGDYEVE